MVFTVRSGKADTFACGYVSLFYPIDLGLVCRFPEKRWLEAHFRYVKASAGPSPNSRDRGGVLLI
jgi:hypothetical protein